MTEYLLLLSRWDASPDALSAEQFGVETRRLTDWVGWLTEEGHFVRGGQVRTELVLPSDLVLPSEGVPPAARPGGTRSDVGSFLLFDADDMEAAMAIARSCPVSPGGVVRLLTLDAGAGRAG